MKIRFAVITIALALSASGAKGDASKAAVCVACHGVDGNSINPIWPNLAGQGAEYTVQQLNAFKTKKRNNAVMWPFASNLTEEDMWDLAIYYSKQKISISPTKTATSEDAAKLYRGWRLPNYPQQLFERLEIRNLLRRQSHLSLSQYRPRLFVRIPQ